MFLKAAHGEVDLLHDIQHSRAVADTDPEKLALFGSIALVPVHCKPGRHGLASTLFEILWFRPVRMRTQVLVWSLAKKASKTFPIFRLGYLDKTHTADAP